MGVLGHRGHKQRRNKASRSNLWGLRTYFKTYGRGNFPGHHVLGCLTEIGIYECRWVQTGLDWCVYTHRQWGKQKQGEKSPERVRKGRFRKCAHHENMQSYGIDGYGARRGLITGIWG